MTFKVSTRLDDIDETFDTGLEALDCARAWTKARIGEVIIEHDGTCAYTVEEFALRLC